METPQNTTQSKNENGFQPQSQHQVAVPDMHRVQFQRQHPVVVNDVQHQEQHRLVPDQDGDVNVQINDVEHQRHQHKGKNDKDRVKGGKGRVKNDKDRVKDDKGRVKVGKDRVKDDKDDSDRVKDDKAHSDRVKDDKDDSDRVKDDKDSDRVKDDNDRVKDDNDRVKDDNDRVKDDNDQVKDDKDRVNDGNDRVKDGNDRVNDDNDRVKQDKDRVNDNDKDQDRAKDKNKDPVKDNDQVKDKDKAKDQAKGKDQIKDKDSDKGGNGESQSVQDQVQDQADGDVYHSQSQRQRQRKHQRKHQHQVVKDKNNVENKDTDDAQDHQHDQHQVKDKDKNDNYVRGQRKRQRQDQSRVVDELAKDIDDNIQQYLAITNGDVQHQHQLLCQLSQKKDLQLAISANQTKAEDALHSIHRDLIDATLASWPSEKRKAYSRYIDCFWKDFSDEPSPLDEEDGGMYKELQDTWNLWGVTVQDMWVVYLMVQERNANRHLGRVSIAAKLSKAVEYWNGPLNGRNLSIRSTVLHVLNQFKVPYCQKYPEAKGKGQGKDDQLKHHQFVFCPYLNQDNQDEPLRQIIKELAIYENQPKAEDALADIYKYLVNATLNDWCAKRKAAYHQYIAQHWKTSDDEPSPDEDMYKELQATWKRWDVTVQDMWVVFTVVHKRNMETHENKEATCEVKWSEAVEYWKGLLGSRCLEIRVTVLRVLHQLQNPYYTYSKAKQRSHR